ncbi:tRNA pseudouridine(55) synthase TruB [Treponema sp. R80B11-R83G3]
MAKSGLILLNKKPGITSFEALGEIKRALGTGKVGHAGTLDKFAQGLLTVLTGRALRLTPYFSHCDKQYKGRVHFGAETDTLDPEGRIIAEAETPSREKVEQAITLFNGEITQKPPIFSAIHVNGQRASKLARSGEAPQMKEREVTIYKLELESWQPPFADIFVHCSSGTYIRSLARDIALAAGSRGFLFSLTRTQIAGFKLEDAVSGEWGGEGRERRIENRELRVGSSGNSSSSFPTPYSLLPTPFFSLLPTPYSPLPITKSVIAALGLPWFEVTPSEAEKIFHGKPLAPILGEKQFFSQNTLITHNAAAVFNGETLIAVVEKIDSAWKYGCVLV